MKRAAAKKLLERHFKEYTKRAGESSFECYIIQRNYIESIKKRIESYEEFKKFCKKTGKKYKYDTMSSAIADDWMKTGHNFFPIGKVIKQGPELIATNVEILNGQYMWTLMRCFEDLEWHYKRLYAIIGFCDPNLWRAADFGNNSINQIKGMKIDDFQKMVKERIGKSGAKEILGRFRVLFPDFSKHEVDDIKFWLGAMETFRHLIVHARGKTNKEQLFEMIGKSTGFSFTGKSQGVKSKKELVLSYFDDNNGELSLNLVTPHGTKPPFQQSDGHIKKFMEQFNSHVALSTAIVAEYFGHNMYWRT